VSCCAPKLRLCIREADVEDSWVDGALGWWRTAVTVIVCWASLVDLGAEAGSSGGSAVVGADEDRPLPPRRGDQGAVVWRYELHTKNRIFTG